MKSLLLTCAFVLLAGLCFAQPDVVLKENFVNTRLDKALLTLRKNYDIRLAYDGRMLRRTKVNVELRGVPLESGLSQLLEGTDFEWKLLGNTYAVLPAAEQTQTAPVDSVRTNVRWRARVLDRESGESLPFATVVVAGSTQGVQSNEEGYFVLGGIPSDTATIRITYVGYEPLELRLAQFAGTYPEVIRLDHNLSVMPLVPVYGEQTRMINRSATPGLLTMQAEASRYVPNAGEPDVIRALQYQPGIVATGESSGNIHIRGGEADENLVVYDGFTVYHLDHFFGIFSAFNPESIKNIRVHRGWFEPRYGGRTAGVIEVTGKDGNREQTSAVFNANLLSANLQLQTPLPYKASSLIVSARRSLTDAWNSGAYRSLFNNLYNASLLGSSDEPDVFEASDPRFRFSDFSMRISVEPSEGDEVNFSLYSGNDNLQFGYDFDADGDGNPVNFNDNADWGNLGFSGKWSHSTSAGDYASTLASYSRYNSDLFALDRQLEFGQVVDSAFTNQNTLLEEWSLKQHLEFNFDGHLLQTGVDYTGQANRFRALETGVDATGLSERAHTVSIYVQDELALHPLWKVLMGARMAYYSGTNTVYTEPRGSVSFRPWKGVTLKAAGGRYHQFIRRIRRQDLAFNTPDFWRLADLGQVPVLRADQFLAGFQLEWKDWLVDVEGYYRQLSGTLQDKALVGLGNADVLDADFLTGTGEVLGVDLTLERTVGRHTGWFTATFARNDRSFDALDQSYVRARYQHATELNAVYTLRLPRWRFTATWVYGNGAAYTEALGSYEVELVTGQTRDVIVFGDLNGATLPAYHRADLALHYFLNWGAANVEVGVSVFNVYNRTNLAQRGYFLASESGGTPVLGVRDIRGLGRVPTVHLRLEF